MIIIPADLERLVKKLEKHPEIETPWALSTWLYKKGYKMPAKAEEEKYELPTPKQERELDSYQKKLREKVGLLQFGEKAEEEKSLAKDALKKFRTKVSDELKKRDENLKIIPKKAEEKLIEATPDTPKERMEQSRQKVTGPSFIDTKPSGKGKSLEEWASNVMDAFLAEAIPRGLGYKRIGDKKETVDKTLHPMFKDHRKTDSPILPEKASEKTPSIKEMHKDHVTSPDSLYDRWKEGTKLPKIQTQPFASDEDMLVYPDEFKKGMKEEQEHADVTGSDKEATKKIVLAHLAEDPHYYTKLGTVMTAEEKRPDPSSPLYSKKPLEPGGIRKWTPTQDKPKMSMKPSYSKKTLMSPPQSPTTKLQKVTSPAYKRADEDEEEIQVGPAGPIDVSKGAPPGFIPRSHKKAEEDIYKHVKTDVGFGDPGKRMKELVKGFKPSKVIEPKKAEEERRLSPIRRSMKGVPHEKDVTRHLQVIDPVEKKAEDTERDRDYTTWQREKHEEKSKPLLKRVSEKLFGEEDQTSDYVESLKTRKMPTDWKKPAGPKPETEKDLPSERFSSEEFAQKAEEDRQLPIKPSYTKILKSDPRMSSPVGKGPHPKKMIERESYIRKAEEALDMPQKDFDEDALNELYCFMDWMHNKGFEAKDGDKLEEYMDRYDVEQFGKKAEEAQPPAQFKAPEEKKVDEKCPS